MFRRLQSQNPVGKSVVITVIALAALLIGLGLTAVYAGESGPKITINLLKANTPDGGQLAWITIELVVDGVPIHLEGEGTVRDSPRHYEANFPYLTDTGNPQTANYLGNYHQEYGVKVTSEGTDTINNNDLVVKTSSNVPVCHDWHYYNSVEMTRGRFHNGSDSGEYCK